MDQDQDQVLPLVEFVPGEASVAVFQKAYNSKRPWDNGYGWFAHLFNLMSGACLDKDEAREALYTVVVLSLPDFARLTCRRLSEENKAKASSTEANKQVMTISVSSPREQLFLKAMMMRSIVARMERSVWKRVVALLLEDVYDQLKRGDLDLDAGRARLRQGVLRITVLAKDCRRSDE